MIIVRVKQRLGNQLFQYGLARAIAEKKPEKQIMLDTTMYNNSMYNYQLDNFVTKMPKIDQNTYEECFPKNVTKKMLNRLFKFYTKKHYVWYTEKEEMQYDRNVFAVEDNVLLDGYWQSYLYVEGIKEILSKEYVLISEKRKQYSNAIDSIKSNRSVCIHFRRGDYVENEKYYKKYGVCSIGYYKRAIDIILSKIPNCKFYIFSDDTAWVKENFNYGKEMFYIEDLCNKNNSACSDFYLMSLCDHFIISNSSFSWWAAFLGKTKTKNVICPKDWYNQAGKYANVNLDNFIPPEWVRI